MPTAALFPRELRAKSVARPGTAASAWLPFRQNWQIRTHNRLHDAGVAAGGAPAGSVWVGSRWRCARELRCSWVCWRRWRNRPRRRASCNRYSATARRRRGHPTARPMATLISPLGAATKASASSAVAPIAPCACGCATASTFPSAAPRPRAASPATPTRAAPAAAARPASSIIPMSAAMSTPWST